MVQWLTLLVAILVYTDEKQHREWQRNKEE